MNRISAIAYLVTLAVIMIWPGEFAIAWAHAFPNAEQPLVGSTVTTPPSRASITYDAPIESLFAKLQVIDGAGQEQTAGSPSVGPDHRTLSVELKPLKPGDYTVKWSVVAEDGHRTEGSYDFIVSGRKP
jgi:methionine-rich copper-binding protein CopC